MSYNIRLEKCKRSNPLYKEIRDRHYIPNKGAVGQQLHYLVYVDEELAGIISGGSAAFAVKCRDDYFGLTADNRQVALNGIIDNTVFRLEKHLPNLGTQVLSLWRKTVVKDWKEKYGVEPCGFETFIVEETFRKGSMYKADNWTFVGVTSGSTKEHKKGLGKVFQRNETDKKLVYCKWIAGKRLPTEYHSTWNKKPNHNIDGQMSIEDYM